MVSPNDYPDSHPGWTKLIAGIRKVAARHPDGCNCRTYCLPNRGRPGRRTRYCQIPGCGRKHKGRGYCDRHYKQWRRTGRTWH